MEAILLGFCWGPIWSRQPGSRLWGGSSATTSAPPEAILRLSNPGEVMKKPHSATGPLGPGLQPPRPGPTGQVTLGLSPRNRDPESGRTLLSLADKFQQGYSRLVAKTFRKPRSLWPADGLPPQEANSRRIPRLDAYALP